MAEGVNHAYGMWITHLNFASNVVKAQNGRIWMRYG